MTKKPRMSNMDEQVTENLRRLYGETAAEPVPARFMQLLEKLREQDDATDTDESGGESNSK
ncbi:RNA polymerase subunit sigma-70 [Rhodobacteraceae bacterium F11138]|nr:RNA polymerase subunit sigma-70 [Rhodobacteraceae bacterium F11138]